MSDPVTHAEIEDVLSSIRRLVSEDTRVQPAAPEPAARLVLTPALRVQEPETREEQAQPEDAAQGTAVSAAVAEPVSAPEVPAELKSDSEEAAGGESAASLDASAAEAPAEEPAISFRHHRLEEEEAAPAAQDSGPQEILPDNADALTEPDAEPVSGDAPWGNPNATLFAAAAGAGSKLQEAGAETAAAPAEDKTSETAGARAASVVRKIAELEARGTRAEERAPLQWEPDSQTEAPFAGSAGGTIEWHVDEVPAEEGSSPEAGLEAEEVTAEAAFTGAALEALSETQDTYLDEDSLRDLVASIVREELQGPLGERITRNVRKLVRREIHRALAAHDLL